MQKRRVPPVKHDVALEFEGEFQSPPFSLAVDLRSVLFGAETQQFRSPEISRVQPGQGSKAAAAAGAAVAPAEPAGVEAAEAGYPHRPRAVPRER